MELFAVLHVRGTQEGQLEPSSEADSNSQESRAGRLNNPFLCVAAVCCTAGTQNAAGLKR